MAVTSLTRREHGETVAFWTLANYRTFFTEGSGVFVAALWNSIEVTLIVTVVSVLVAYPIAYVLAYRVPARWQRMLLVLLVLPFWTSYVIRSYSWLLVLSEKGVISAGLQSLGLASGPIGFGNNRGATVLGFVHFFTMLPHSPSTPIWRRFVRAIAAPPQISALRPFRCSRGLRSR